MKPDVEHLSSDDEQALVTQLQALPLSLTEPSWERLVITSQKVNK